MAEKTFVDGMIVRKPHPKAPDWVKASISFKVEEFIAFIEQHQKNGWVNVDVNLSKKDELYAALNEFTPKPKGEGDENPADEPPF